MRYTLRVMIHGLTANDIPLLSQWIKKDESEESSFLVPVTGVDGLCPSFARCSREHPIVFAFGEAVRPLVSNLKKENPHKSVGSLLGAGDRGRTGTVSLPLDFESSTSANSITPANITRILYYMLI